MPEIFDEFHAEKHSIINEMFIATADDNYVLARWSFHHHLNVDFFWLAVHSVEKYLKAALLMNGKSTKKYGHSITKLLEAVKPLAPELFPITLTKPDERMPAKCWRDETMENFITRLYRDGQADNRYQIFGYIRHPEDLWKLDQVVYSIRRVCKTLEAYELGRPQDGATNMSNREVLGKYPKRWHLDSKLEETMSGKHGQELLEASLICNFPFTPHDHRQSPPTYTSSAQNPVLARRLFDPLEGGSKNFAHNDVLWDWVKTNIHLPQELAKEIEEEREKIKAKSSS
ncbi:MAG TPA: HEPN domain-containing protein [Roseiarcus sp.]|nr:HEPN domain-containing protein [Roseiarcus sp.]